MTHERYVGRGMNESRVLVPHSEMDRNQGRMGDFLQMILMRLDRFAPCGEIPYDVSTWIAWTEDGIQFIRHWNTPYPIVGDQWRLPSGTILTVEEVDTLLALWRFSLDGQMRPGRFEFECYPRYVTEAWRVPKAAAA